jgi:hypothetical protein
MNIATAPRSTKNFFIIPPFSILSILFNIYILSRGNVEPRSGSIQILNPKH